MTQGKKLPPIWPIVLVLVGLLCVFFSADASGQGMMDRLEAELQRTDRLIELAREMLSETSNVKATELLQQAIDLQSRAWEAFHSQSHQLATQLTKNAQNLVTKAVGLMNRHQENESVVDKEIERTDDLLDRVQEEILELNWQQPLVLLNQAIKLQDRAKDLYSERNLKQALNLTLRARNQLQRLLQIRNDRKRQRRLTAGGLERVEQAIEDSREAVYSSKDEAAQLLHERGVQAYERAVDFAGKERWAAANVQLSKAAADLRRALRLVQGEEVSDNAERALLQAETRLERLLDRAAEIGNRAADDYLTEAQERLATARELYEQGEYDRVLVIVRVVMELEQQAARILGE